MPRFHFDIHNGEAFSDEVGIDFPDVETAQVHAVTMLSETLQWIGPDWISVSIAVRDGQDAPVLRVFARIEIERRPSGLAN